MHVYIIDLPSLLSSLFLSSKNIRFFFLACCFFFHSSFHSLFLYSLSLTHSVLIILIEIMFQNNDFSKYFNIHGKQYLKNDKEKNGWFA